MYSSDSREISTREGMTVKSLCYAVIYSNCEISFVKTCQLSVEGESEGYTVKTKEKDIAISDYPLLQTEFLYGSKTGTTDIFEKVYCIDHTVQQFLSVY